MSIGELTRSRRMLVLAICCMSLFIVGLDVTVVNVALPSIQRELNASVSGLQWVVAAYSLVLASLLMLAGSTADRGRPPSYLPGGSRPLHARLESTCRTCAATRRCTPGCTCCRWPE